MLNLFFWYDPLKMFFEKLFFGEFSRFWRHFWVKNDQNYIKKSFVCVDSNKLFLLKMNTFLIVFRKNNIVVPQKWHVPRKWPHTVLLVRAIFGHPRATSDSKSNLSQDLGAKLIKIIKTCLFDRYLAFQEGDLGKKS